MSYNPPPNANPAIPQEGKSHADMVAEMLSPDPQGAQPIGDFRLAQWDEFAQEINTKCFRQAQTTNLPIKYADMLLLAELAIPGDAKYQSPYRAMAILANFWAEITSENLEIVSMTDFLNAVRKHIETYTIPRYSTGCQYTDPLCKFTLADIDTQLTKYVTRYGRMERGDERVLDIMKMAHYYQVGWSLWSNQPEPQSEPQPKPKSVWARDTDKYLNLLWHRVRSLEGSAVSHYASHPDMEARIKSLEARIHALESRPWLTKEQEMFVRLHTPTDI